MLFGHHDPYVLEALREVYSRYDVAEDGSPNAMYNPSPLSLWRFWQNYGFSASIFLRYLYREVLEISSHPQLCSEDLHQ